VRCNGQRHVTSARMISGTVCLFRNALLVVSSRKTESRRLAPDSLSNLACVAAVELPHDRSSCSPPPSARCLGLSTEGHCTSPHPSPVSYITTRPRMRPDRGVTHFDEINSVSTVISCTDPAYWEAFAPNSIECVPSICSPADGSNLVKFPGGGSARSGNARCGVAAAAIPSLGRLPLPTTRSPVQSY